MARAGRAGLHPEPRALVERSTATRARWCSCRPSGCPRSSTRAPATPSGSTRSRTRNPLWVHPRGRRAAGRRRPAICSRSRPPSAPSWTASWVTEAIRPGIVACSHHLGRWRLAETSGGERWSTALVDLKNEAPGRWRMRQIHGVRAFESEDPDSEPHLVGGRRRPPEPHVPGPARSRVSGQHCWHQKVARDEGRAPTIATATSSSTPPGRTRSSASGSSGPPRAGPGQPPPPALAAPRLQARRVAPTASTPTEAGETELGRSSVCSAD